MIYVAFLWVCFLIVCAIMVLAQIAKASQSLRVMRPDEEAKYELHPTVTPQTMEITDANVRDVIDISIEDGVNHPALKKRIGFSDAEFIDIVLNS